MLNPTAPFPKEFVSLVPTVSPFKEVIEYIHADLCRRSFNVGFCYKGPVSGIRWHGPNGPILFLYPFSGTEEHPLNALWDLIHEWGHSLDAPPPTNYKCDGSPESLQREIRAWDLGWFRAIDACPNLSEKEQDFRRWKTDCLSSYNKGPSPSSSVC